MGIFSSFFKKNKLNSEILSLVNLQDSIIMPPDSFFKDTKNKELCEQYYQGYKEILSSKKTILSLHLKDIETDDIRVYIDILTSLELHIHDILDNPNKEEYNINYVNNILARLNTYCLILNSIEEESFLRLAALSSLKSTPFLSRNKKNAIDNEISRLQIQILNAQKDNELISSQINSCLNLIEHLKLKPNTDFIKDLNNRLSKYLQAFNIDVNEENIIYKQIKLEKYLFKNKNVLTDLNETFKNLLNNSQLNREDRINQINILIDKYMAIKEYKRIEDINLFYNLIEYKINTYEIDYNIHQEVLSDLTNYPEEKEMMKQILLQRVNNFLQNPEIFERYIKYNIYRNNYREFAKALIGILKDNYDNFNYDEILESPILTGLVLSIEDPIKIKNYFRNFHVNKNSDIYKIVDIDFDHSWDLLGVTTPLFTWSDNVPLETIARLWNYNLENLLRINGIKASLTQNQYKGYLFYQIYNCLLNKVINELPATNIYNGATTFNMTLTPHSSHYKNLINGYNESLTKENYFILPKSLKKLIIDASYYPQTNKDSNISKSFLHEGLEELNIVNHNNKSTSLKNIEIPSTIKNLRLEIVPETITFRDYTNSLIVNDKELFLKVIKKLKDTTTITFKGKTDLTSFNINKYDVSENDVYTIFKGKITEKYNQLYKIATFLEFFPEKKEGTLENLKNLENSLNDFLSTNFDEIKMNFENQLNNKTNHILTSNKDKHIFLNQCHIRIISLNYLIEILSLDNLEIETLKELINYFKSVYYKTKFEMALEKLPFTKKSLINKNSSLEEKGMFKTQLKELINNETKTIINSDNKRLWLLQELNKIIDKYKNQLEFYEFLLTNPFLLELQLSIFSQSDEYIFNIFRKYTISKKNKITHPANFDFPYEDQVSYNCIIDQALRYEFNFNSSDESLTFINFIRDLIPFFKKIKPKDSYYIGEGIKKYSLQINHDRNDYFANQSENKNVILPNSLEYFRYYRSKNRIKIKSLTIGKNLILLNLEGITLDHLVAPDYIQILDRTDGIRKITFLNFENSLILTKEDTCREFIKGFICSYDGYNSSTLTSTIDDLKIKNIILKSTDGTIKEYRYFYDGYGSLALTPTIKDLKAKSIVLKPTNGTIKEISIDKFIPKSIDDVKTYLDLKYLPNIIDRIYNCIQHELQIAKKENKNLTRKRKR